jgi:hypothetical protein
MYVIMFAVNKKERKKGIPVRCASIQKSTVSQVNRAAGQPVSGASIQKKTESKLVSLFAGRLFRSRHVDVTLRFLRKFWHLVINFSRMQQEKQARAWQQDMQEKVGTDTLPRYK